MRAESFSLWHTVVGFSTWQPLTNLGCLESLAKGCLPKSSCHVSHPDSGGFVLWDLKSLWGCLRQRRGTAAGSLEISCSPGVSATGSSRLSLRRNRKWLWKYWRHSTESEKKNRLAVLLKNIIQNLVLKNRSNLSI